MTLPSVSELRSSSMNSPSFEELSSEVRGWYGRGLLVRERGGLLRHDVSLRGVILGVGPIGTRAEDLRRVIYVVARFEVCDPRPYLLDDARDICTQNYGRFEHERAASGAKLGVHGVGSRGDTPGPGPRRVQGEVSRRLAPRRGPVLQTPV